VCTERALHTLLAMLLTEEVAAFALLFRQVRTLAAGAHGQLKAALSEEDVRQQGVKRDPCMHVCDHTV
jgi:hypothetical protein